MSSSIRNSPKLCCVFAVLVFVGAGCTPKQTADPRVAALVQSISERQLHDYAKELAAIGSRPGHNAPKTALTVRFIETELKNAGYQAVLTNAVGREKETRHCNIIAEVRGTRRPECIVELGAHYDTVPFSPGADDNGSGVVGVLTAARALATARCSKTIRFVFYCLEETAGAGSRTHVQNILENKEEQFGGAIVFEMIGCAVQEPNTQCAPIRIPFLIWPPSTGDFVAVVGNSRSAFIGTRYESSARAYEPDLHVYSLKHLGGWLKDAGRSDHASYWQDNLPAVMLTDTANFRNPNYHQPSDCIETLNIGFMTQVTRAAAATLLEWAETEPDDVEHPIPDQKDAGVLTFRHESVETLDPAPVPLQDPTVGLCTQGLTREAAGRQIATEYWNAAISGDNDRASKLWCGYPSGGAMHWHEQSRPQKVISIGKPYRQEGCFDDVPNLVIPSKIQFSNDRVLDQNLIVVFRDLGLDESCVIIGLWRGSQKSQNGQRGHH